MSFKFRHFCELLQELEGNRVNKVVSRSRSCDPDRKVVEAWFRRHDARIPRRGREAIAFLSSLFPHRRVDRVYEMQEASVSSTFGRCLQLSTSRKEQVNRWRKPGGRDVASCVESVMRDTEFPDPPRGCEVMLQEVDDVLEQIAARAKFSSPEIRSRQDLSIDPKKCLPDIVFRMKSWEAKWLVRLILKDFGPVSLDEEFTMQQYHFLLADMLRIQNSFASAVARIQDMEALGIPRQCSREQAQSFRTDAAEQLAPAVGLHIQRPKYEKARSIKHCCDLAAFRRISLERKYDGEYCQVHINTSSDKPLDIQTIKLFSKSGKDSTKDRERVRDAIKMGLRLWQPDCKIKERCILEGELLVYNDSSKAIEPFRKIRKHVSRSGRFLGTEKDSPIKDGEHLMIMFYDILLWDDEICIYQPHDKRRLLLRNLITIVPGRAEIGTRQVLNFNTEKAVKQLRNAFAKCITDRWEGFLLKGCNDPYFASQNSSGKGFKRCIKLKKDYIAGLGDTVDFAVVGGRFDAKHANTLGDIHPVKLSWTSFHIACLTNRNAHVQHGEDPHFRVVDIVGQHNLTKEDLSTLNQLGQFEEIAVTSCEAFSHFRVDEGPFKLRPMAATFRKPFVLEMMGAGFDRPANASFQTLRFPRSSRLHLDRSFEDSTTFSELQEMAEAAAKVPDHESQEDRQWIEMLQRTEKRRKWIMEKSQSTSPGRSTQTSVASIASYRSRHTTSSGSPCPLPIVRMDSSELRCDETRSSDGCIKIAECTRNSIPRESPSKKRKESPFAGLHPTKRARVSPPVCMKWHAASTAEASKSSACLKGLPLREIGNLSTSRRRQSVNAVASSSRDKDMTSTELQGCLSKSARLGKEVLETRSAQVGNSRSKATEGEGHKNSTSSASRTERLARKAQQETHHSDSNHRPTESIPTPPRSSAMEVSETPPTRPQSPRQQDPQPHPMSPPARRPMPPQPQPSSITEDFDNHPKTINPHPHIPFFLAKSIADRPPHAFTTTLQSVDMAFTYSENYFLDAICTASDETNAEIAAVVIVRQAEASAKDTALTIASVKRGMLDRRETGQLRGEGRVVFLDYTFLPAWPYEVATELEDTLHACFAGSLGWGRDLEEEEEAKTGVTGRQGSPRAARGSRLETPPGRETGRARVDLLGSGIAEGLGLTRSVSTEDTEGSKGSDGERRAKRRRVEGDVEGGREGRQQRREEQPSEKEKFFQNLDALDDYSPD